jgi:hypothetical protein
MNGNFWISELGRIYERSTEAIENSHEDAIEPLAEEFNYTLSELKDGFQDNEIIASTDPVEGRTEGTYESRGNTSVMVPSRRRDEALHEIRSRCERMANALNYELPELESGDGSSNRMVMVSVDSNQEVQQEVSQEVTVESVMELIELDPQAKAHQDELREITEKFNEELENNETDSGKLRQFIEDAKQYSTSVAAKLAMLALQAGAIGVLGL